MGKNKLIYFYFFLLFLCVLLILYSGHLFISRASLNQSVKSVLVRQGGEFTVVLDINNNEPSARNYTISVLAGRMRREEHVYVGTGRTFTYMHHIYPPLEDKRVNVSVYREDEPVPVSKYTYVI